MAKTESVWMVNPLIKSVTMQFTNAWFFHIRYLWKYALNCPDRSAGVPLINHNHYADWMFASLLLCDSRERCERAYTRLMGLIRAIQLSIFMCAMTHFRCSSSPFAISHPCSMNYVPVFWLDCVLSHLHYQQIDIEDNWCNHLMKERKLFGLDSYIHVYRMNCAFFGIGLIGLVGKAWSNLNYI